MLFVCLVWVCVWCVWCCCSRGRKPVVWVCGIAWRLRHARPLRPVSCMRWHGARAYVFFGCVRRAVLAAPVGGLRGSNPGARRHRLCGLCVRGGAWARSTCTRVEWDSSHRDRCDSCIVVGVVMPLRMVSFLRRPVWVSRVGERICGRLEWLPYGHRILVSAPLRRAFVCFPSGFGRSC